MLKKFIITLLVLLSLPIIYILIFAIPQWLNTDPDATYELRGRYKDSPDGKTYLVIEDDNGGKCGPLEVNGKPWPHRLFEKGQIEPGEVSIECGTWIGVTVRAGTTYFFDYWGP
ncbi:hypothetical protein ACJJIK_12345 [Microbulbifer sp. ZKSA006]|uniref:hypothetical protein n=1 Tax=Microbulbifer sp. ZKSA006 TaxID=3243390 RepID=UPI00403A003E